MAVITRETEPADIAAGDTLEPFTTAPIERLQLVKYAGASGDFNPIHTVEKFATDSGYPSVFAHGMLIMGFLGRFLTERFGVGNITKFGARFVAITWPGESITCGAEVVSIDTGGDTPLLELALKAANEKGEVKIDGSATVALLPAGKKLL